jgi:hypothetical protein
MTRSEHVPAPVNDPRLMRLVRVRVVRPFRVAGKPLTIGEEVEIPFHVACDLRVLGKCEILGGDESHQARSH